MEKVYQITKHTYDYDEYSSFTIGIFTDKEVAEGIVSKLNTDMDNKLNELYANQDELDKDESKKYKDKSSMYYPYTQEYLDIDSEIRDLQRTSYSIKEIIINQLIN